MWRTRVDSQSTAFRSSTMRLVLQSSTISRQMFIQHYHTSWIASSTSSNLHMAWTPSTRYRDGIQWHDEPCFFRSKIICEDSELQMTRWTTITKAKAWSPRIWCSMCFLVNQLSCKWFFMQDWKRERRGCHHSHHNWQLIGKQTVIYEQYLNRKINDWLCVSWGL